MQHAVSTKRLAVHKTIEIKQDKYGCEVTSLSQLIISNPLFLWFRWMPQNSQPQSDQAILLGCLDDALSVVAAAGGCQNFGGFLSRIFVRLISCP
jgi:hypothetical protein